MSQRTGTVIAAMLDRLGPSERLAFLKLATGNLRIGLSARLARTALAQMGGPDLAEIEELWRIVPDGTVIEIRP